MLPSFGTVATFQSWQQRRRQSLELTMLMMVAMGVLMLMMVIAGEYHHLHGRNTWRFTKITSPSRPTHLNDLVLEPLPTGA